MNEACESDSKWHNILLIIHYHEGQIQQNETKVKKKSQTIWVDLIFFKVISCDHNEKPIKASVLMN